MAKLHRFSIIVLSVLLLVQLTLSADPPQSAPSPAPGVGSDLTSPPPAIPSPSPQLSSPPAPPPSDLAPGSSPTPLPNVSPSNKSPAPAPDVPSDASSKHNDVNADASKESSGGLKGGQKAGVAIAVIAGVCIVALGAILYRKRKQNIQRSQYGYAARREIL